MIEIGCRVYSVYNQVGHQLPYFISLIPILQESPK
jgi:hypothetical protein